MRFFLDTAKIDEIEQGLELGMVDGVTTKDMRAAIWEFVQRHQKDKLAKHVRRGNLNGLSNFLDIFRTLNSLLLAFNKRHIDLEDPIVPHAFLTTGMLRNLELLLGPMKQAEMGFVDSIKKNLGDDIGILQERLQKERVAEMVRAAVEALTDVRRAALEKGRDDKWSSDRIRWVDSWIAANGLDQPSRKNIDYARQEYGSTRLAA